MRWLLGVCAALALLTSPQAFADMYPNAANAKLPEAINSLTAQGIPVAGGPGGSMDLTGGGWWLPGWWGGRGGQNTQWLLGSPAAPITTPGTPVVIGVVQGKTAATCDGVSANAACNSALLLQNMGTSASTMVTAGLTAYAETQSTAGLGVGNAQAGNFISVASAGAQTGGLGLYSVGMRFGANGSAYGAEISAWNRTTTNCDPVQYYRISRCDALYVAPRGPDAGPVTNISSMIHIIKGNTYGRAREGLVINNETIDEKAINDQSEAPVSINIGGTHTNGILFEAPSTDPITSWVNNGVTNNSFNDLSNSLRSINIAGTHSEAAIWVRPGAGYFGLNVGVPPIALFHMGGTVSVPYTDQGYLILQASGGITDTTSSGVVAAHTPVNFLKGTPISATNPTTYTVAETLHVGEPIAGTNMTFLNKYAITTNGAVHVNTNLGVGPDYLVLATGEIGLSKIAPSASAPGVAGAKLALVCGTGAGTAKLIAYGGSSTTPTTIADNIGAGVAGC